MTAFELNEELKDGCILLGATKAVTTHFKEGFPLLPEPFWETIVVLPKQTHLNLCKVIFSLVEEYMCAFEEYGFNCADPVFEYSYGEPRIIYAIFPGKHSFTKKKLKSLL
jgi:hypothetical protein